MSDWHAARFITREASDMLLTLPDIRQKDTHDCGEAAVRVVLRFLGISAAVRLATRPHGTDPVQIESAFRNLGLGVTAGEMSVDDLRHFCDSNRPVIALVHWPKWSDSHYIVVRGVIRGTVYFHDVLDGPGKTSRADFDTAWHADGRVGTYRHWCVCPWIM